MHAPPDTRYVNSGQAAGRPEFMGLKMKSNLRVVGKFKVGCGVPISVACAPWRHAHAPPLSVLQGLIRIMKKSDRTPPPFDLKKLMAPQPYKVRVYMLEGNGLQPKDSNGKSDPYIKVGARRLPPLP